MINKDWTVQVQFDGKKVLDGFRKIDDMYKRVARSALSTEQKKEREIARAYAQRNREVAREQKEELRRIKQIEAEERRRLSQKTQEERAAWAQREAQLRKESKLIQENIAKERRREAIRNRADRVATQQLAFEKARNREVLRIARQEERLQGIKGRGGFKAKDDIAAYNAQMEALALRKKATAAASTRRELIGLSTATDTLVQSQDRLIRKARQVANTLSMQQKVMRGVKNSAAHLATSYLSLFAAVHGARSFYRTGKQFQSMEASLLAASGSAEIAEKNMRFLENTSKRLGISLTAGVEGFNKLGIAARSQGYPLEELRRIYTSIAESATAFGLNAPKQNLVFLAVSQMISKAKVSAEELRRQLGDSMPIAIEAMRRAYSDFKGEFVDMSAFTKQMEQGNIMSKDVMGSFARHMSEMAREGGALSAAMAKLLSQEQRAIVAIQEAIKDTFADESVINNFTSGWKDLEIVFQETVPLFKALGTVMGTAFKAVTTTVKTLMPLLKLFGIAITNMAYPFRIMTDVVKKLKEGKEELTGTERVIIRVVIALKKLQIAYYNTLILLNELTDKLAVKEDDSMFAKFAKGAASWAISLLGVFAGFRAIKGVMGWFLRPVTGILKWMFGLGAGKELAKGAAKMGGFAKILRAAMLGGGMNVMYVGIGTTIASLIVSGLVGYGIGTAVNRYMEKELGRDNFIKTQDWIGRYISAMTAPFSSQSRENLMNDYKSWRGSKADQGKGSSITNHVEIKIDNAKEDTFSMVNKALSQSFLYGG